MKQGLKIALAVSMLVVERFGLLGFAILSTVAVLIFSDFPVAFLELQGKIVENHSMGHFWAVNVSAVVILVAGPLSYGIWSTYGKRQKELESDNEGLRRQIHDLLAPQLGARPAEEVLAITEHHEEE